MSRQFILCPEINPQSFVLLFIKGDSGTSWSIRDYSVQGTVSVRYGKEFSFTLAELAARITAQTGAPSVSASDLAFWHTFTLQANANHDRAAAPLLKPVAPASPGNRQFPLLHEDRLVALAKAAKSQDIRRIRTSPNSEDYVTWNVFALVQEAAPHSWWKELVSLAKLDNPSLHLPQAWEQTPQLSLWQCVAPPPTYEASSRQRMTASGNAAAALRAKIVAPVEGDSEIDISLRNAALTLFIEAKLGADISLDTTHDPQRNQIVRNIDCVLHQSGNTQPLFWMLVRDRGAMRAYTQLMRQYRDTPATLAAALPHCSHGGLESLARNLAVIRWADLLEACFPSGLVAEQLAEVHAELCRRTSPGGR